MDEIQKKKDEIAEELLEYADKATGAIRMRLALENGISLKTVDRYFDKDVRSIPVGRCLLDGVKNMVCVAV